jgi:hypothetical protein
MQPHDPGAHWAPPPPSSPLPALGQLGLPAVAPTPPAVRGRPRRRWRLLIGALICAALAAGFGTAATSQYRADQAPGAVVGRYFAALAAGDAATALALAEPAAAAPYLTATVLRRQLAIAPITDLVVRSTLQDGRNATVQVSYRLDFGPTSSRVLDAVDLVRSGTSWRLVRAGVDLRLSTPGAGANRLTFAGRALPSGQLRVFPGALPVGTDNPAVQPAGQPLIRLVDEGQDTVLAATLSPAAQQSLARSLDVALRACLAGTSHDPHCPQPDGPRPIPGSLRGTELADSANPPSMVLSIQTEGLVVLTGHASVRGSWRTWDFNNQPVLHSGLTSVDLHAKASIADLSTVYWDQS